MKQKKIFLIGMPGSGKSTIGRKLADNIGLQFIDLDDEVEKSHKMTIKQIFELEGEDGFRSEEKNQLEKSVYEVPTFVMATGGGTPCFFDNMKLMKTSGLVVFIDVPPKILSQRLIDGKGIEQRPLIEGHDTDSVEDELTRKLKERLRYYSQAQITITEGEMSVTEVQRVIEEYYKLPR